MTAVEFKRKWSRYRGKESAAYQEHFNDLCRLLGGDNRFGQTSVPAGLTDAVAVAAGGEHSVALRRNGPVVVWGDNEYGELSVPPGLGTVVAISAGGQHTLAGTQARWHGGYVG